MTVQTSAWLMKERALRGFIQAQITADLHAGLLVMGLDKLAELAKEAGLSVYSVRMGAWISFMAIPSGDELVLDTAGHAQVVMRHGALWLKGPNGPANKFLSSANDPLAALLQHTVFAQIYYQRVWSHQKVLAQKLYSFGFRIQGWIALHGEDFEGEVSLSWRSNFDGEEVVLHAWSEDRALQGFAEFFGMRPSGYLFFVLTALELYSQGAVVV